MTEDRLRSALEEYAEPLRYHPPVSQRRRFPVRLAVVGASGLLASFVLFGVLTPRSPAAVMQRMQAALTDVRTMRAETALVDPKTGKETVYVRRWYDQGRWRIHARINRFRERVVLLQNDRYYSYLPTKNVVTFEPMPKADDWEFKGGTALEFAMNEVNTGQLDVERQARLESGPDGMDRLILERKEDDYRCVIDVDRQTGLPIRARTTVNYEYAKSSPQISVFRFYFNEKPDPSHFDPAAFNAPIVDLIASQARYGTAWSHPLAKSHDLSIRDAAVAPDGTVFITASGPSSSAKPDTLRDARGTLYLRLRDIHPGGVRADTNAPRSAPFPGQEFYTTVWTPLEPLAKPATQIQVGLSSRSINANAVGVTPHLLAEIPVPLRRLKDPFPEFSVAFVMETAEDELPSALAALRARHYARVKDWDSELRWLHVEARERAKLVPRWGKEAAATLARRYREFGHETTAKEIEREFGLVSKAELP